MDTSQGSRGAPERPPALSRGRSLAALAVGFALAAPFYLLLIDITDLPELYAGAGIALLAAIGFAAGREQGFAEVSAAPTWLLRAWRGVAQVPPDVLRVSLAVLRQLARPRRERGVLRAVPFDFGAAELPRDAGRRALAEAVGSLAPNTIVIGIDRDRNLILAHQLQRSGGAEAIDVMGLG